MPEVVLSVVVSSLVVPVSLDVSSLVVVELVLLDDGFFFEDVLEPVLPVEPVVPAVLVPVSDVEFADELSVSVEELLLLLLSLLEESLLSFFEESEAFFLLSSLAFFFESLDWLTTSDELVDVREAPSLVFVTELVTTLVAPSASAMETMANGVIKGGVRYAMLHSSFYVCSMPLIIAC